MGKKYKTIYADPPWNESGGGKIKRGADRHYPLMKTSEIKGLPIQDLSDENCHLYLWVTNNFLKDGLDVMESWGFRYITKIDWGKVKDIAQFGLFDLDIPINKKQLGLGQYFRGVSESCLFGVKGNLPVKEQGLTLILEPRNKHSQKPKQMYEMIERCSYEPRIELFARKTREGWDVWGNEVESDIILTTQ